jgi:hypothetical protein
VQLKTSELSPLTCCGATQKPVCLLFHPVLFLFVCVTGHGLSVLAAT